MGFPQSLTLVVPRVGVKELADFAHHEFGIEVALYTFWEPAGIDEELPKGIGQGGAVHVFQAIDPRLSSRTIDEEQAIGIASQRDPISITNVHADGREGRVRAGELLAFSAPMNVDDATERQGRVACVDDLDACGDGLKLLVIGESPAAKEPVQFLGSVACDDSGAGLRNFTGANRWSDSLGVEEPEWKVTWPWSEREEPFRFRRDRNAPWVERRRIGLLLQPSGGWFLWRAWR